MACMASYPSIVRHAPSTDRNPRLAVIRFLMNRWSCSITLFKRCGSAATAAIQFTTLLQFGDRAGVCRMAIDVDDARTGSAAGQSQPQERLRRDQIPLGRQQELDRLTGRIHGPVQVGPTARDLNLGFIYSPGSIRSADLTANSLIQNRRIALDPAPDRNMIDR